MPPRIRKIVGMLAMLAFIAAYIALAVAIAERLPDNDLVQLIYFVIAGVAWTLPLIPLLSWMDGRR